MTSEIHRILSIKLKFNTTDFSHALRNGHMFYKKYVKTSTATIISFHKHNKQANL